MVHAKLLLHRGKRIVRQHLVYGWGRRTDTCLSRVEHTPPPLKRFLTIMRCNSLPLPQTTPMHTYLHTNMHAQTMTIPGTTTTVQFIFIDTVILCGATHPTKRSLPPPGPQSHTMADDEWAWINDTLATSTADWILMFGHYPGEWAGKEEGRRALLFQNHA